MELYFQRGSSLSVAIELSDIYEVIMHKLLTVYQSL